LPAEASEEWRGLVAEIFMTPLQVFLRFRLKPLYETARKAHAGKQWLHRTTKPNSVKSRLHRNDV
jgi:hypothetical protein